MASGQPKSSINTYNQMTMNIDHSQRTSACTVYGEGHDTRDDDHHSTGIALASPRRSKAAECVSALIASFILAGCNATQPTLPVVDDTHRKPVNSAAAIELQTYRAQASLLRQRLEAGGSVAPQACELPAAGAASGAAPMKPALPLAGAGAGAGAGASAGQAAPIRRVVLSFERGQTRLELDDDARRTMRAAAEQSEWVHVQGRSDAAQETPAETQIARRRAENVAQALVQAGVPATKLRMSWLGMADSNASVMAAANGADGAARPRAGAPFTDARRVEVDFVERAPVVIMTVAAPPPASVPATLPTQTQTQTPASGPNAASRPAERATAATPSAEGSAPQATAATSATAATAATATIRALAKR
jgi:hypothetical protein